jgi:Cu2+-exporting ATPase
VVYEILETQNQLAEKDRHPLLQQAVHFGIISNPALVDKIRLQEEASSKFSQKWVFEVEGMWCPSCAELIRLVLGQRKGIRRCSIDYITDLASIEFDPTQTTREQIQSCVGYLGYASRELQDPSDAPASFFLILRFAIAAFCALNIMMFSYPLYATYFDQDLEGIQPLLAWISLGLCAPVILFSGFPIYKRMWVQIQQGRLALEALVGIGTLAAALLSLWEMFKGSYHVYFDTTAVVITFLLLGKIIESRSKFSTKAALLRLHHVLPRKGRKKGSDGNFAFVPIKDIHIGDEVLALSGERIVLDGEVVEGEGACDESLLTGEAQPVWKRKGDRLLSGTIVQAGSFRYRTNAVEQQSTLHRILALIEKVFMCIR